MARSASMPVAVTLVGVAAVVTVVGLGGAGYGGVGLLNDFTVQFVDDAAQFLGALAASSSCLWTARRYAGGQRAWRLWMAAGMGGWAVGQLIWSWNQLFGNQPLPSPSWADAGYLSLAVPALLALVCLAGRRHDQPDNPAPRTNRLVLVLDGLVLVGSLFVLTWATALGAVVRAGAPTWFAFTVAIAYPVTDLMLVVIVVLLLATSRVPRAAQHQLALLGGGLFAICFSDSLFAYVVASGAARMPPLADAGFIIGPPLLALAAWTVPSPSVPSPSVPPPGSPSFSVPGSQPWSAVRWGHLLLPYIPVFLTLVLFVAQMARRTRIDNLETYVEIAVIVLLVVRQGITLVENAWLLARVSEGQQRLTHQAFHDALTGLANRALFRDRLDHALALHQLDGGPLAVLFLDLDDFKQVNDHYGHAVGDRLLRLAGDRLRQGVRGGDTVARLGGDEFAVLLEGPGDADDIAQQLLDSLRRPYEIDGRSVVVGASIGFVEAGSQIRGSADPERAEALGLVAESQVHHLDTAESLVRRADAAMYAGKRRGKNTLVRYHLDLADETGTSDLSQLLAAALTNGRGLDVHYQPIVRLADGAVVAVEALARWTDPVIGPVPADLFITTAERVGLVGLVDDFVLDRACRDAASFDASWSDVVVHVNISAARLGHPDHEKSVLAGAAETAARLTARGVLLALDDFGTGYNALAQLHALPVDVVKLDRSFVTAGTARSAAMCRSIATICGQMGVKLIAEGIENAGQAAAMAALGCGYGQGHRYGRPAPLSTFAVAQPWVYQGTEPETAK